LTNTLHGLKAETDEIPFETFAAAAELETFILIMSNANATNIEPLHNLDGESGGKALAAAIVSNVFLFLLIFGLSATVEIKSIRRQLGNKVALLTGFAMQFIALPLLGYLAVLSLGAQDSFTNAMGLSLLVVTSSPGGSYSNWWCSMFNADLALSVAMTTGSTILAVGMLPANLFLYSYLAYGGGDDVVGALDFGALFISLGIVIGAIVSGLFASYKTESIVFRRWANRGATISGIALMLVSFLLSTKNTESRLWAQDWTFYVAVAFPCVAGMTLANIGALSSKKISRPECVAISIECCYQNTGIATSVAITMFDDPVERAQAVAVPLFYGLVEALVIGLYCIWAWKVGWTKAPKDEKLCVVIAKSYEVEDDAGEVTENVPREDKPRLGWWSKRAKHQDEELGLVELSGASCTKARMRTATSDTVGSDDGPTLLSPVKALLKGNMDGDGDELPQMMSPNSLFVLGAGIEEADERSSADEHSC
jgi:predicted Na+-dependent transporter